MFINAEWDAIWLNGIDTMAERPIELIIKDQNFTHTNFGECITVDSSRGIETSIYNLISIRELNTKMSLIRREVESIESRARFVSRRSYVYDMENTLKYLRAHIKEFGIARDKRANELLSNFSQLGYHGMIPKDKDDFGKFSPSDKYFQLANYILEDIKIKNWSRVDQIRKSTSYSVTIGIIDRAKENGYVSYLQAYMVAKAGGKHLR